MTVELKFSTGKVLKLTPEEYKELLTLPREDVVKIELTKPHSTTYPWAYPFWYASSSTLTIDRQPASTSTVYQTSDPSPK